MKMRGTRARASRPVESAEAEAVERALHRAFTPAVVDALRAKTGYNPRQRVGTAFRLMITVVEAFLAGLPLCIPMGPTHFQAHGARGTG